MPPTVVEQFGEEGCPHGYHEYCAECEDFDDYVDTPDDYEGDKYL